ncbi:MAG: DUF2917 domain-containing protein [Paucibacter sp.]|nr:DUF2917 domain-containing protein [Roseateles sp.]
MSEQQALWSVEKGEALSLMIGPGARALQVVQGRVWITQSGHGEDLWLAAGQSVQLDAGEDVLIEAWPEAQFQLLVPPCVRVRKAVWTWPRLLRSASCVPA